MSPLPTTHTKRHTLQTTRISPTKIPRTEWVENCISVMAVQFSAIGSIDLQPEFYKSKREQLRSDKNKYLLLR